MQSLRAPIAADPLSFGKASMPMVSPASPPPAVPRGLADDLKLFGTTFVAGFIFVSLFIA